MVGDARELVEQISFRIDVVQFGGTDGAVDCGGAFAAGVRVAQPACSRVSYDPIMP